MEVFTTNDVFGQRIVIMRPKGAVPIFFIGTGADAE